jgi:hypothetical protein
VGYAAPVLPLPSDSSAATASALTNASEDKLPNELCDIEFNLDLSCGVSQISGPGPRPITAGVGGCGGVFNGNVGTGDVKMKNREDIIVLHRVETCFGDIVAHMPRCHEI